MSGALAHTYLIFSPYLKVAIPISAVLLPELFPRTVEWVLFRRRGVEPSSRAESAVTATARGRFLGEGRLFPL